MFLNRFFLIYILILSIIACTPKSSDPLVIKRTYSHPYGPMLSYEGWKKTGQNGVVVTYFKSGRTVKQSFQEGVLEGESTETFPYSTTAELTEFYRQGKLSLRKKYTQTGLPLQEELFQENLIKKTLWFNDGSPCALEQWEGNQLKNAQYFDKHQQLSAEIRNGTGKRLIRDSIGTLQRAEYFVEGVLVSQETFHPNGIPASRIFHKQDLANGGQRLTFNTEGQPLTVETWKDALQDGLTTLYFNGQKREEIPYIAGFKEGIAKTFDESENVVKTVSWRKGQMHGPSTFYLANERQTEWFFHDKPVSKMQYELYTRP